MAETATTNGHTEDKAVRSKVFFDISIGGDAGICI